MTVPPEYFNFVQNEISWQIKKFLDDQRSQKLSDRQFLEEAVAVFTPVE